MHTVWEELIVINIKMKKTKDPHQILQIWFSSSFPIGSYAYSHGLEALIDDKKIKNKDDVKEFLDALLFYGTLRNDYIFMKSIYKGEEINELIEAVENNSNQIHEAADVFYHLIMYLEANNIKIEDIMSELNKRKK